LKNKEEEGVKQKPIAWMGTKGGGGAKRKNENKFSATVKKNRKDEGSRYQTENLAQLTEDFAIAAITRGGWEKRNWSSRISARSKLKAQSTGG